MHMRVDKKYNRLARDVRFVNFEKIVEKGNLP